MILQYFGRNFIVASYPPSLLIKRLYWTLLARFIFIVGICSMPIIRRVINLELGRVDVVEFFLFLNYVENVEKPVS